ncbi:MAG: hypothetical protein V4573_00955 [Pseudomonadota bacterium]
MFFDKFCRFWLAALVLLASVSPAIAQTCALPGWDGPVALANGIVNAYHGGSGSPAAGATSISVASATGLRTNTRALRAGDLILIMQMQDSSTGANAGLHEYAQIVAISGTTLSLNRPLTNSYNQSMSTSSVRNWQVIWVPQYSSATISGTVSADRWTSNTTTGVVSGGVVALDVTGSLAFNGTVTVAGAGFRGAMGLSGTGTVTATVTTANITFNPASVSTVNGGQKGEGTQGTPPVVFVGTAAGATYTTLLGQGYALGAGGQAAIGNAGGGANDGDPTGSISGSMNSLNAGGGGGANAGAGGQGGNSWNNGTTATAALNQGTNTNIGNVAGGKGGNTESNLATRLVLGGGGGAGAANNATANVVTTWPPTATSTVANGASGAVTSSGASGGGAVLIRAGSFSATAGVIDARGYSSYNKALPADTDSAGGGGGGGSVFISAGAGTAAGLTVNASGGAGGSSNYYNHGPGGGGGGGYILSNITGGTFNVAGGINGTDACCSSTGPISNGSPKAWNSAPGNAGTVLTTGGAAAGVQGGASCLPVIAVTKSTTTPSITTTTGATASYSINLSNSGGAASNVFLIDATLPPGWSYTAAIAPTYAYNPAPPPAANSNAAGAETTSASAPGALPVNTLTTVNTGTAVSLRAAASAPGVTPTTGNNTVTFGSFYLPQNSSVTVSFVATIPNTATVGVYHNPAGVIFLDPTRTTGIRMVSPAANVTANRNAIGYSANTTYTSGGTTTVGGSNYSGLAAGPTTDDVTLLPDLSVTKSLNTPTFTIGTGSLAYVVVGRNNGRPIADQVYANTQATGQSATAIISTPLSITDTLPVGMTLTALTNNTPAVWTCTANATSTTFTCSASAAVYPMAAATNLVTVTAPVAVSSQACPGPAINTATFTTSPLGDAVPSNNTGTVTTPINCATNLTVTKTDGKTTVTAGGTTSYTVTFASLGPATGDGAVVLDTPGAGLSCSVASCTPSGTGVCPVAGQWPNLLSGGLTLSSFASGSTLSFVVSCNVTATGQ